MALIMIIDDDPISSTVCKALLTPLNQVIIMKSGIQALGYLNHGALPDLIILDAKMPECSGFDLLKTLRNQDSTKCIPIIYEAGSADLDIAIQGYKYGATDLIVKPIIPILLQKKVELLLRLVKMEQENHRLQQLLDQKE